MNARQSLQHMRNGLAKYFVGPTFVEFIDGYGQAYAGLSVHMLETSPDPGDESGYVLPLEISFREMRMVRIVRRLYWEHYLPGIAKPAPAMMRFGISGIEVKTFKIDLNEGEHVIARTTFNPNERLLFSRFAGDMKKYSEEVLETY